MSPFESDVVTTPAVDIASYVSDRPQVSMGYNLINHEGRWQNTIRICKPQAAGEWFMNSLSVLPTPQVVYQSLLFNKL